MTMKNYTVSNNVVNGNNTVHISRHFKLEGTSTADFHVWDSAGKDVCNEVVDKCPFKCGEKVQVLSNATAGNTYQLGTNSSNNGGSKATGVQQGTNGDLTVGSG